ncbi:MAG: N-acyl homoserine lactonase family protein [Acidilobaceae archaeon]|nr:N-acyl homoserine lactonase family protein [Acidilobaceae archaeon]MDW7973873.1 N-acyl homoserine lactonase family protein [Sulfolobales archaeon]
MSSLETGVRRIYLLDFGILAGEPGWFVPNPMLYVEMGNVQELERKHKWIEIPVSGALVEHKDGYVLYDTGGHPEASKVWTQATFNAFPVVKFTENNRLENQLKLVGLRPEDITYVVFSHMHLDHIGQAYLFKEAGVPLVVHKKELQHALYLYWMGKVGGYQPVDLEALKGANWFPLDLPRFELLPGVELIWVGAHTPGSMMMKVTTDEGNTYVFTGDFTHIPQEIELESKGWLLGDFEEFLSGMKMLKLMLRRPRTQAILGHDPHLWEKHPRAPKFLS